jgi:hypothetical protein
MRTCASSNLAERYEGISRSNRSTSSWSSPGTLIFAVRTSQATLSTFPHSALQSPQRRLGLSSKITHLPSKILPAADSSTVSCVCGPYSMDRALLDPPTGHLVSGTLFSALGTEPL